MDLDSYYKTRKEMVDKAVKEFLEKEGLTEVTTTPLGGKRLRGVLTLIVCETLGGKPGDALDAAVAIELAHAASLDADDIVDMDKLRRGKPATWISKGVAKAVLASHGLVASALNLVKRYGMDAMNIFVETYSNMVQGEVKDVLTGGFYETIIGAKTASLWAAAGGLGAIAAKKNDYVDVAKRYGYATGMAFQIADDIVDVVKLVDKHDIAKLKQPSAMAFLASLGIQGLLQDPLLPLRKGLKGVREDLEKRAASKLDKWVKKAKQEASKFPESDHKKLLEEYPELSVKLMLEEMK